MSTPAWDTIPLLALKCILEYLNEEEALLLSTTCRHWRSAMLMYDGRRHRLSINADKFEKNSFVVPLFKKNVRSLYIIMEPGLNETAVSKFTKHILPHFLESVHLEDLYFVGPLIMTQKRKYAYATLKRMVVETLVSKHVRTLERLGVYGCEITAEDENDESANEQTESQLKQLSSSPAKSSTASEDSILSRACIEAITYSNLNHIIFDLELVSTDAIATLAKLDSFRLLSLNVTSKKGSRLPRIQWNAIVPLFKHGLEVAMNIIAMPFTRMQYVLKNALCPGIPMVSVKFLFCKYFYMQMITRVAQLYNATLRDFSWVDAPRNCTHEERLIPIEYDSDVREPFSRVNPFVLLAWQCPLLMKLEIHGYWFCEYDLVGVARLRPTAKLDVSSVYNSTAFIFEHKPAMAAGKMVRVLVNDLPPNSFVKSHKWTCRSNIYLRPIAPSAWEMMHEGLRSRSTANERADYIITQTAELDVT